MPGSIDTILRRHPDRVPVHVQVKDNIDLERSKYLVPKDMTAGQFTLHVRKSMKINSHEAIFMFVDRSILPPISKPIGELYKEFASHDGMLYVIYTKENTFG